MKEYYHSEGRYLKLDIALPYKEMCAEAFALLDKFSPHRGDEDSQGWESLTIHGLGWDKHENYDVYGYKKGKDASNDMSWTEIADKCPVTVKWLKEIFPCAKYGRVRFMLLRAGGKIALHSDSSIKLIENINVALNNPVGCKWIWGDGEEIIMEPGGVYAMNLHYHHSVINESNQDRMHMIIARHDALDGWKRLIEDAAVRQGITGEYKIIDELP
jgi:Aspartyl/Asparaginyl beta-hydroxylase